MKSSYSNISVRNRQEFEGRNYKKYLKKIYYMGMPKNGRQEYYATESLALQWILKSTGIRLTQNIHLHQKAGDERIIPDGVICLDKLTLYWDRTFYLEDDRIWFCQEARFSEHKIEISAGKFTIKILHPDWNENNVYITGKRTVYFEGPVPLLESVQHIEELDAVTTYIFNIKWNNSKAVHKKAIPELRIKWDHYRITVWDLTELRAVILPQN
jgi:hypothetical protein